MVGRIWCWWRLPCQTLTDNSLSPSLFLPLPLHASVSLAPPLESSGSRFSSEQQCDGSVQRRGRSSGVLPHSHDQACGPVPRPDPAVGPEIHGSHVTVGSTVCQRLFLYIICFVRFLNLFSQMFYLYLIRTEINVFYTKNHCGLRQNSSSVLYCTFCI